MTLDLGAVDVQLFGYNFTASSTVNVNGIQRQAKFIGPQLLVVSLTPIDTGAETKLPIVVSTDGKTAYASLPVLAPKANLSLLSTNYQIGRETQLLLLALIAGALGSYLHAIRSLADYIGNRQLIASWFWFYVTKPFVGMALALVFYAAIRGGFVAGSPADAKSVNPFGVFAVAAMVGMFADKASAKLADIFDALFKGEDKRKDPLQPAPLQVDLQSLKDATQNTAYSQKLDVKGGTAPYQWAVTNLPAGLLLDNAKQTISGSPTAQPGTTNVTLTVTDGAGQKATKVLPLTIH